MNIKRPLKAPSAPLTPAEIANLQFPVYASLKKDGIRGLTHPELGLVSATMKPIPNHYIRETINSYNIPYLDGELVIPGMSFNDTQSVIMSRWHSQQKLFKFLVFDYFLYDLDWIERYYVYLNKLKSHFTGTEIKILTQHKCQTLADLECVEETAVAMGEEGVMIRSPYGTYKQGRSTYREGYLLKIVRHVRDEATIIGMVEQEENCNDAITQATGLTKRSSHQANKHGKNILGAFICDWKGHKLKIGTGEGLTHEMRRHIWLRPKDYIGKTITFKYKPFGMKDLPRAPIFVGFRNE